MQLPHPKWWWKVRDISLFHKNLGWWNTLQGTNISPKNGILKIIFLFPRWDMLIPWRVVFHLARYFSFVNLPQMVNSQWHTPTIGESLGPLSTKKNTPHPQVFGGFNSTSFFLNENILSYLGLHDLMFIFFKWVETWNHQQVKFSAFFFFSKDPAFRAGSICGSNRWQGIWNWTTCAPRSRWMDDHQGGHGHFSCFLRARVKREFCLLWLCIYIYIHVDLVGDIGLLRTHTHTLFVHTPARYIILGQV